MKKMLLPLLCFSLTTLAQTPPRKAIIGLLAKPGVSGIIVDSIVAYSSFDELKA